MKRRKKAELGCYLKFEAEWKIVHEAAYGTGIPMGGFSWPELFLAGVWDE